MLPPTNIEEQTSVWRTSLLQWRRWGTSWPTCRFCCPRCKKLFEIQFCMSARQFCRSAGRFCISGRKTCMAARHFHRSAGPLTILLFYYFISIGFHAAGFCISGRKTCMSARHFHRSAGPSTVFLFCYSTISFPLGGGFCISERQSCMSAHVFACRPNVSPHKSLTRAHAKDGQAKRS